MPVIEAQCASILVPHDHGHINHDRMVALREAVRHAQRYQLPDDRKWRRIWRAL